MTYIPPCPDPLLGEDLTLITVQGLARNDVTGAWATTGSEYSLMAYIRSVRASDRIQTKDIRPVSSPLENYVPFANGEYADLACIRRSLDADVMSSLWHGTESKRFLVSWIEGSEQCVGYFTGSQKDAGVEDYADNTITWSLQPMNPGTGQKSNVTREPVA